MRYFTLPVVVALALGCAFFAFAQEKEPASWAPKYPPRPYTGPHKPHTKLAEVKALHAAEKAWRHQVVDDDHLMAAYVQDPAGTKVGRRFKPDTRSWWVVLDGEVRFEIEGQEPVIGKRWSMIQVPAQTIYSIETLGNKPSLRFEVDIGHAKTLYPGDVQPPALPGVEWLPVTLRRKPFPYGATNKPLMDLGEMAKSIIEKGAGSGTTRFIHDDRAVSNAIYGFEKSLPKLDEKNRGHYHTECAEFWLIMSGQIRYPIEGQGVKIASEGDVVYVPPFTFHAPRAYGDQFSTRLAMNGYTNIAHLFDTERPH